VIALCAAGLFEQALIDSPLPHGYNATLKQQGEVKWQRKS
jgi:hypothetical protein